MVSIIRQLAPDNTDANSFRAWGGQLSADLTAMGLVKTNDTGQIDWANIASPGGNGVVAGYEIRRFNDTLQPNYPVVFKIEYGGGRTTDSAGIYLTVGTGSDGGGKITGLAISTRASLAGYNIGNSTPQTCVFSGEGNRCAIAMFVSRDPDASFFSIERTKDASGQDTGEGILVAYFSWNILVNGRTRVMQFVPFTKNLPPANDSGIFAPTNYRNGLIGIDFMLYPNFFFDKGKILNPGITHLGYFNENKAGLTQGIVNIYGVDRNYYFLGNNSHINYSSRSGYDNTCLAMLFE